MDPDATLAALRARPGRGRPPRALGARWRTEEVTALRSLAEAFKALDEWLTKGGFPPKDWRRGVPMSDDDDNVGLYLETAEQARQCAEDGLDLAETVFTKQEYMRAVHEREMAQVFATLAVALAIRESPDAVRS